MASFPQVVSCRYRYDPLDRLASAKTTDQAEVRAFYQKSRLATEVQGALQRTVFQHDDQLLAQHQYSGANNETSLLVTDQQRSVIQHADIAEAESLVYTAYGHLPADSGLSTLLGFSGERRDPVTGHYLLGNGYRAFNPVLMRFNSPDSLSPFDMGGLNAYAYCQGDPVNYRDPTGHIKYHIFINRGSIARASSRPYSPPSSRAMIVPARSAANPSLVLGQAAGASGGVSASAAVVSPVSATAATSSANSSRRLPSMEINTTVSVSEADLARAMRSNKNVLRQQAFLKQPRPSDYVPYDRAKAVEKAKALGRRLQTAVEFRGAYKQSLEEIGLSEDVRKIRSANYQEFARVAEQEKSAALSYARKFKDKHKS